MILHAYDLGIKAIAFSTTRQGGNSKGNYHSFNINNYCGDNADDVAANRALLCETLNIDSAHLIVPHQVHGTESRMIAPDFFALPDAVKDMLLDGVDCVMTDVKGTCIGVSTADCVPVLLYDEAHHAAAAVHAGWRGTLNRIVHKTIVEMRRCYGTKPDELRAVIGPSITVKNFEVGQEVYDQFAQLGNDMDKIAQFHGKWHIDLPLCNLLQMTEAGIPEDNIINSGICTYDDTEHYFSARRLGIDSGRIYTGIMLR